MNAPRETTDWPAIAALFVAGLAAAMQFSKLAPILDQVAREFHYDLVEAGFSVSVLGMVGVLFAISAGAIVASIGLKRGILIALFGGALVAACGAFITNGPLFLLTRFLEGFSHLLIVVSAPALMAAHATPRDKPIALALWGCFFGLGFAITSAVAPPVLATFGWRGLLGGHAALLALTGIAVSFVLNRSGFSQAQSPLPRLKALLDAHRAVYRSGAPLLMALTFCAYTLLFLASLTFLGRFLIAAKGWSAAESGSFMAFVALVTLCFTLAAGVLVRHHISMRAGLSCAFAAIGLAGSGVFMAQPDGLLLMALIIVLMAGFGLVPGFVFANMPRVAPTPERAALTYGALAQFGNVGTFAGTPIFAAAFEHFGWAGGGAFISLAALGGLVLTTLLTRAIRSQ